MISYEVLHTGLRLAMETMPAIRSVTVSAWIGTGSRHEFPHEAGISHFVEHLVFKGTERRSAESIANAIDSVGGDLNAATDRSTTSFHARVPADCLELAVDLVADLASRPAFAERSLETELGVILEEISRYEDTPEELVHDHLHESLWPDNPLGLPVTGNPEALAALGRAQVVEFHRRRYTAGNAVVSIAGCFEPDEARRLVGEHFRDLPPGEPGPSGYAEAGRITPGLRCQTRDQEQVHLMLAWPGCSVADPARYAQAVLDGTYGATTSSRLFRRVREERGLAYSVWSEPILHTDTGALAVYAGTGAESVEEVVAVTAEQARSLANGGMSPEEFELARRQFRGATALELEATDVRAARNARSTLVHGGPLPYEEFERRLAALRLEDVREAARRSLASAEICGVAIGPIEAEEFAACVREARDRAAREAL